MDMNQVARMIEWLDEERRRDKNQIAKLEETLMQQHEFIETLTRRLNGVESDHTALRSTIVATIRESDMFDQIRAEMSQMVESTETRRLSAEREAERLQNLSRDNMMKSLRDAGERIEKLEQATTEIGTIRVERDRFASAIAALQQRTEDIAKKMEEPERRIAFLEEQRRQDARRLSEAQTELPDMQRAIEGVKAKLELLEDMALRNEKKLIDVQNTERDRRDQITQFVEQQTLFMQQRDQHVNELARTFTQYDEEMRRNLERFETWAETYRQMRKALEDFERVGERLERRINEVGEGQRLSEERFRQEWTSWNADDQKRWKQFTLTNDEAWRLHDKDYDQYKQKFAELNGLMPGLYDQLDRLWKVFRAQGDMYKEHFQAIIAEFDQPLEKQSLNGNGSRR
jgi:chromosome segregation ATPase